MEFDILAIMQEYAVLPLAGVCYLVGWLLKNSWAQFPNKFIPLAMLPVGLVGVLWLNSWALTPHNIMSGICSAALAVYLHQNGKQLLTKTSTTNTDAGGE